MANRWCDGLGRYGGTLSFMLNGSSSQAWAQVDGNDFSLSSANPRTGTHCLRMGASFTSSQIARRVFGEPLSEVFFGCAIFCHSLPTSESVIFDGANTRGIFLAEVRDQANGIQLRCMLGTDGAIEVRRGDNTVLGRTVPVIGAGAYQHMEIYVKASNSAGAVEIRIDEVTRLNLTGIDTVNTANVEFSQWALGHDILGGTAVIDFADFFVNDTEDDGSGCSTFIGDCKSGYLPVNADTGQADFAKSSGTVGYSLLNEAPPVDGGYITTSSSTAESDFGLASGPSNLSEILTVRPFIRAFKDDAGTCTMAPSMISNSVKAVVDDQPIATAPAYYDSNVPFDPDVSAPWTLSSLNAAIEVVERTA